MKQTKDLTIVAVEHPADGYVLLKLAVPAALLQPIRAGQFVEVRIDGSPHTFLRRPLSINYVDVANGQMWLLVQVVGDGTRHLSTLDPGEMLNVIFPLGNGFTTRTQGETVLLVGGGVGMAPLLEYGRQLKATGAKAIFLLGGRSADNLLQLDMFRQLGDVHITTEDGSLGTRGFVTDSPLLHRLASGAVEPFSIACCGPKPMMQAVARWAKYRMVDCEVSLENMMACGLGACLCCVEKTVQGNVCVCKEGPVFNINQLTWQI